MALTWAQKKATMREFISTYYAETLQQAGFVSYKDEGFHWYKLKNDLLYKVHMPIFSPASPVFLSIGYGAIPLFTWETIAPTEPYRDWPLEMRSGSDHYADVWTNWGYEVLKRSLGPLPRQSYGHPSLSHFLSNDMFIDHLNTPRCGAEVLGEAILPVLEKLGSFEEVYLWNKTNKFSLWHCFPGEDVVEKVLSEQICTNNEINWMSIAFSDECLYMQDEEMYPIVLHHLKAKPSSYPKRTKKEIEEFAVAEKHNDVLIRAIESGDRRIFEAEAEQTRNRMLEQIKKKLPNLTMS